MDFFCPARTGVAEYIKKSHACTRSLNMEHGSFKQYNEGQIELTAIEQVPFGKKNAYLITSPDFFRGIKDRYEVLITNHQDIGGDGLFRIKKWPHMFTVNISHTYWYLYGTRVCNRPVCMLLDRDQKRQYLIEANFDTSFYDGTLISGEIIKNSFIAQDILIWKNSTRFYLQHNLSTRHGKLRNFLTTSFHPDPLIDPLDFWIKPYFQLEQLSRLDEINEMISKFGETKFKHLIFTPIQFHRYPNSIVYRLRPGELKHNSLYVVEKHKAAQELTLTKSSADGPDIYFVKSAGGTDMGLAYVCDESTSKLLRERFRDINSLQLKCVYNNEFKKWQPVLD